MHPRIQSMAPIVAMVIFTQLSVYADAQVTQSTRLLSSPAMSTEHIAFVYAEDLWIANRDGTDPNRLTSHVGAETNPRFSPDGRQIAFTGEYDGNLDVYTISIHGGEPRRLTWHPGADIVQDFTPDGRNILITSSRHVYTNRYQQLFEVPITGAQPNQLSIPNAFKACYSPDGSKIAYVPIYEAFNQWKNYRGGTYSRIWLFDRNSHEVSEIPQPEGRCNDTDPMWTDKGVFFRSDRDGEFNLYRYDVGTKRVERQTNHEDFPILSASKTKGAICYEQAGYLHTYTLDTSKAKRLEVTVSADLNEVRPHYVSGENYIRAADISPTGARAVFEFRGDIVTVPEKKGDPRNLTKTTGAHERSPVWSPDGRWIAYFSDASGEYELHVAQSDGLGGLRKFRLDGAGFYDSPSWSPDGEWICFSDNSWTLSLLELESGRVKKVASEPIYGPLKTQTHSWSPCSKWLTYTQITHTYFQRIWLYDVEKNESHPLTDGLSDCGSPVFDASGKYLYFTASTDAGPVLQWFAMSNADMGVTNSLYLVVLSSDEMSPLAPESDEESFEEDEEETPEEPSTEDKSESPDEAEDESKKTRIDLENIDQRILSLPLGAHYYQQLQSGDANQLYYLKSDGQLSLFGGGGGVTQLCRYDLKERAESVLAPTNAYALSHDKKKVLINAGGSWSIAAPSPGMNPSASPLGTNRIQVLIDPRAEWEQIYHEAWRINRDYFYDPNMHGADWPAMRKKYAEFIPHLAVRSDLNRLIQWLCSELAVGHHSVFGGDRRNRPERVSVGLLGADFEADGKFYRFKKVFGGLNWNPNLRSPLTEPGVQVEAGDYLLEVNGETVSAPQNLYRFFEATADRQVVLKVSKDPEGTTARTVSVVPVSNEAALRNRDWVEGNLKRVHEATNGRVAYVYVPNTTSQGHTYFKRYFYPQADKEAIIVDERHNGGGQVADYYIDILRRPYISHWATRYGKDFKTPISSIQGPKVMLIDETAGSGGDLLPWMFRKLGLGPLIGRPTWGGLVGMLGTPPLLDGGMVTAPNLAIWTEDGFIVENVGVPPDIEIEQTPKDVIAGRDPQLEKAIEHILELLEKNPPKDPIKPPFPTRVRR